MNNLKRKILEKKVKTLYVALDNDAVKDSMRIVEELMNEGPAYEYANYVKKIEKAENQQAKEVNNLVKLLQKKGLKKEATFLAGAYMKSMREFDDYIQKLMSTLN